MFKYLKKAFLTRKSWVAILFLLQLGLIFALGLWMQQYAAQIYIVLMFASLVAVAILLDKDDVNPVYKLMWMLIILLLPPTGTVLYLYWGGRSHHGRRARHHSACTQRANKALPSPAATLSLLPAEEPILTRCAHYLAHHAHAPAWDNTSCKYYPWGEDFLADYLEELNKE